MNLAKDLESAWYYYDLAGYKPPDKTDVLVHKDLKSEKTNEPRFGEWDHRYLHINAQFVPSGITSPLDATAAHEYWHAIFQKNWGSVLENVGLNPHKFPWLDEAMATAFESEIFPMSSDFLKYYPASNVRKWLAYGLIMPCPSTEGDGNELWPWGKYLIHKKGHEVVREMLDGKMNEKVLSALFRDFALSLLIKDYALDDPKAKWSSLTLQDLSMEGVRNLGEPELPYGFASLRPLSFTLLRIDPNPVPEKAPKLIIRQKNPDPTANIIVLRPTKDVTTGDRRPFEDMIQGAGAVIVDKQDWLENVKVLPVALVCTATAAPVHFAPTPLAPVPEPIPLPPEQPNSLLIYYLQPPTALTAEPPISIGTSQQETGISGQTPGLGNTNSGDVKSIPIKWKIPQLDGGLKPEDCLGGYRVFIKKGAEEKRTDILFKPTDTAGGVPLSGEEDAIGLASEDAVMTDPATGLPLHSEIIWVSIAEEKPAVIVPVGCKGGYWILNKMDTLDDHTYDPYNDNYKFSHEKIGERMCRGSKSVTEPMEGTYSAKGTISWDAPPKIIPAGSILMLKCEGKLEEEYSPDTSELRDWVSNDIYVDAHCGIRSNTDLVNDYVVRCDRSKSYQQDVPVPWLGPVKATAYQPVLREVYFSSEEPLTSKSIEIYFEPLPEGVESSETTFSIRITGISPGGESKEDYEYIWKKDLPKELTSELNNIVAKGNFKHICDFCEPQTFDD